jgi:hypothetical protein
MLGSVSSQVVHRAACPVAVISGDRQQPGGHRLPSVASVITGRRAGHSNATTRRSSHRVPSRACRIRIQRWCSSRSGEPVETLLSMGAG